MKQFIKASVKGSVAAIKNFAACIFYTIFYMIKLPFYVLSFLFFMGVGFVAIIPSMGGDDRLDEWSVRKGGEMIPDPPKNKIQMAAVAICITLWTLINVAYVASLQGG